MHQTADLFSGVGVSSVPTTTVCLRRSDEPAKTRSGSWFAFGFAGSWSQKKSPTARPTAANPATRMRNLVLCAAAMATFPPSIHQDVDQAVGFRPTGVELPAALEIALDCFP